MDMGFSKDTYESFAIFQGKINEEYQRMIGEFGMVVVDATKSIEAMQEEVRRIVSARIDLASYRLRGRE
jgi:dTMP kinase